jgi:hypothetical protein
VPSFLDFARESRLPSYWANRIQEFLSGARTDLRVSVPDGTHVEVVPAEPYGIAAIDLQGRWRWIEEPVSRVHPGGGAGTFIVWAVATDQDVVNVPKPFTDETDYTFSLRITKSGEEPSGAGVEVFEKIAEVDWDGAKITALRQTYNAVQGAMIERGAFSESTDIVWTRSSSGGLVASYAPDSIGAADIAPEGVGTSELVSLAVTTAKVAAEAITESKIGTGAVTEAKIAALAVTTAKIAANAITESKIGASAVNNAQLVNLSVNAAKLAAEAVTGEKVAAGAIVEAKLAAEAVGTGKIANLAVTAAKIAEEAISTIKLANLGVTTAKLAELCVTEAKLADGAVTTRKFKPTAGVVYSNVDLVLGAAYADAPGAVLEITPAVAGILRVIIVIRRGGVNGGPVAGTLGVDGVDIASPNALIEETATEWKEGSATQVYDVALTAAKHTIKLRAKKASGTAAQLQSLHSGFAYELRAS